MPSARINLLAATLLAAAALTAAPLCHPILALHGYNGDADTWADAVARFRETEYPALDGTLRPATDDDLLVMEYYAEDDGGYTALGCSTDTPIAEVAELVRFSAERFLAAYGAAATVKPTFNVVCHSMGGLVFRQMLADLHAEQAAVGEHFFRCADLGTPHYGQALKVDEQSREMHYAHPYLWRLAAAWHFAGANFPEMNYIIGCGKKLDFPADGLVDTVSASMLTRQDADFAARVAYVNRKHSTLVVYSDAPALCEMASTNDVVFQLIHATFSETATAYGDGSGRWKQPYASEPWRFLLADGYSTSEATCTNKYAELASLALAFFQVAQDDDRAIGYDVGTFWNDKVINSVRDANNRQVLDAGDDSEYFEQDQYAITNGNVLIWLEDVPNSGTNFKFKICNPYYLPSGYSKSDFNYFDSRTLYGGGGNIFRTYPLHQGTYDHPFSVATCAGTLETTTAALHALGLVPSAYDNTGAAALLSATAPNGLSWPLCLKLGVVADGQVPPLVIRALHLGEATLTLTAGVGTKTLAEINFAEVRLLTGSRPDALDTLLAPLDDANPAVFPLPPAPACFRLQVRE